MERIEISIKRDDDSKSTMITTVNGVTQSKRFFTFRNDIDETSRFLDTLHNELDELNGGIYFNRDYTQKNVKPVYGKFLAIISYNIEINNLDYLEIHIDDNSGSRSSVRVDVNGTNKFTPSSQEIIKLILKYLRRCIIYYLTTPFPNLSVELPSKILYPGLSDDNANN